MSEEPEIQPVGVSLDYLARLKESQPPLPPVPEELRPKE